MITPTKLKRGDEIRVVSPSKSLALIDPSVTQLAEKRLRGLGLKISYGQNSMIQDEWISSSIDQRVEDIHMAFSDSQINAILTAIGGYNCNQLLPYIDFEFIQKNPKIFCGYSDITVLSNAFWAKCSLMSYSGPHFSTFGCLQEIDYIIENFQKTLFHENPITLSPSPYWSDDKWYIDQNSRDFIPNQGVQIIQEGECEGTLIGGNLSSFCLLLGTSYCPSFENSILLIEDDSESHAEMFDRQLQSILQQKSFSKIQGAMIGRFQKHNTLSYETLKKIIDSKKELKDIPILSNLDFGHTFPMATLPIGGKISFTANLSSPPRITFLTH